VLLKLTPCFGNELTKDWVHDENAALFGWEYREIAVIILLRPPDLAKMMQMYMNYGSYNATISIRSYCQGICQKCQIIRKWQ